MKKSATLFLGLFLAILVVVNIMADKYYLRLDLTEDSRYTLSDATKSILRNLDKPVTVKAYFSKDLPTVLESSRRELSDLLTEYARRSNGNVVFEFFDPSSDPKLEQKAIKEGIKPVVVSIREKDEAVQKQVMMGLVIYYGDKKEVLPMVQPEAPTEYLLTTIIKKLAVAHKPVIGLVQGHGEPSTSSMGQVMASLGVMYAIETVQITDSTRLSKYETVILLNPSDTVQATDLAMLDGYLAAGGDLLVAYNNVTLENAANGEPMGQTVTCGVTEWLKTKGIVVEDAFVIDDNSSYISVPVKQGRYTLNTQVKFPYMPIITSFEDHPATSGLDAVVMQFASPIRFVGDSAIQYTPLAKTSKMSGVQKAPLFFDVHRRWESTDYKKPEQVVAALFEGKLAGGNRARLIVITDGDFPVNGEGQRQQRIQPDNVNLLVNAVDWLSDDTGLIELRTQGVVARLLDPIDDKTKAMYKWINFLLPLLLGVGYGIFRVQKSRIIRKKRMEVNYV